MPFECCPGNYALLSQISKYCDKCNVEEVCTKCEIKIDFGKPATYSYVPPWLTASILFNVQDKGPVDN